MLTMTNELYGIIAKSLIEKIGDGTYLNGTFEGEFPDSLRWQFHVTLIIYRDEDLKLTDIVPVWWELKIFDNEDFRLSDFNFSDFKNVLKTLI